jgi:hypothetical protein
MDQRIPQDMSRIMILADQFWNMAAIVKLKVPMMTRPHKNPARIPASSEDFTFGTHESATGAAKKYHPSAIHVHAATADTTMRVLVIDPVLANPDTFIAACV